MKYYELELGEETVKFRLRSSDSVALEKKTGAKLLDLIQDYSMTTIVLLLQYLRRGELPQFSMDDAHNLYDKLIDNDYTLETILFDVIYEAMVVSGFLAKDDLESIKTQKEEAKKEAKKTPVSVK